MTIVRAENHIPVIDRGVRAYCAHDTGGWEHPVLQSRGGRDGVHVAASSPHVQTSVRVGRRRRYRGLAHYFECPEFIEGGRVHGIQQRRSLGVELISSRRNRLNYRAPDVSCPEWMVGERRWHQHLSGASRIMLECR